MTNDYRPIACAAHSELERLAMQRAQVRLQAWVDGSNLEDFVGEVADTATHDGAEFLLLRCDGELCEIRLDRIRGIYDAQGRALWRQEIDSF